MQATQDILTRLRTPSMQEYFRTRGFSHVSLFGSYARGTPSKESDLDLLVERSERGFTIFDLFSFERELAKKL